MTGFSRSTGTHGVWSWTWELKSVNAKGLDVRMRLPMGFDGFEPSARAMLSKVFSRGNISAALVLKLTQSASGYRINEEHLNVLLEALSALKEQVPDAASPSLDGLLGLRGVIEPIEDDVDEEARSYLETALMKSLQDAAK
jgi:uncharacterized protein (TIGR00255 family)